MKQHGRCITGDPIIVDNYTADWMSIRLHPTTFYRRIDEFEAGFTDVKGLYTEIDMGQYVIIKFSDKDDVTAFHRRHHEYL